MNIKKAMKRIENNLNVLEARTFIDGSYHTELYNQTKGMIILMLTLELISKEDYNDLYSRLENCKK